MPRPNIGIKPNPHCPSHGTGMSHFEFTDINNMVLKKGGTVAAPRSKTNAPYTAPKNLPMNTFGGAGEITAGEGIFLGVSAPVIVAATAGIYAVGGMFSAFTQEYFIGNKRSLSYRTIAKRNAVLGGVFGLLAVGGLAATLAKS